MVIDRHVDQKTWKTSIGRRTDLARRNILLDEIREIGRGLVANWFKGKRTNYVLNTGFDRKPV